MEIAKLQTS